MKKIFLFLAVLPTFLFAQIELKNDIDSNITYLLGENTPNPIIINQDEFNFPIEEITFKCSNGKLLTDIKNSKLLYFPKEPYRDSIFAFYNQEEIKGWGVTVHRLPVPTIGFFNEDNIEKEFNFNEFKNNEIELKFIFKDVEQWLQDYIFYEIMSIKIFFNDEGTPVERSFKGSFNEELINLLSDLSSGTPFIIGDIVVKDNLTSTNRFVGSMQFTMD